MLLLPPGSPQPRPGFQFAEAPGFETLGAGGTAARFTLGEPSCRAREQEASGAQTPAPSQHSPRLKP